MVRADEYPFLAFFGAASIVLFFVLRDRETVSRGLQSVGNVVVTGADELGAIVGNTLAITGVNLSRGFRNKNPGNIRPSGDQWVGQIGSDGGYLVFDTLENGLRALFKLLLNYNRIYGINTVAQIVHRWAPNSENNTDAYVRHVSELVKVAPDTVLSFGDDATMMRLGHAIVRHENGYDPIDDVTVLRALARARGQV